jgi:chromosome condensin MukBEF ATPase and DNA-binding subunit MukB
MNQRQQELRRIANRAFIESLEQLGDRLKSNEDLVSESSGQLASRPANPPLYNVATSLEVDPLEEALADIDQHMQARQTKDSEL